MKSYLELLDQILNGKESTWKQTRTGIRAKTITGAILKHDMSTGFPLITTKQVPFKLVASELEFFIKGRTNKKWLQEQGNHIWDDWCTPDKVPYGTDEETKLKMKEEFDLGPIYGRQWRDFNGGNRFDSNSGCDQLKAVVDTLKTNPEDRRMLVSAWNPLQLDSMALPPCHFAFQVVVTGEGLDTLNLNWFQRSVDCFLGLPFNIASYGLLLKLLAMEVGMKEGYLCGMLSDVHIYENHIDQVKLQLERDPFELPAVEIPNFDSIFNWSYEQRKVINYKHHPKISGDIAV
jgi:thymidylate synthase